MKRIVPLLVVVGGVGLVLWAVVRSSAPRQPVSQPAALPASTPPPAAVTAPPAAEAEPIVYQFEDEAKMREFAGLWQQRQKTLLRLAVLRAYWENEQAGSAALNTQLETQYHLSPTGNYILDAEKRVLMERPAPAAGAETTTLEGQPAQAPPAGPEEGTVVHTFSTDEELQAFGNLWQQRQGSGVRLTVLKSFWDEEDAELTKLNRTLTETYTLDVTKNYTLDAQRRVIIERPAVAPAAADVLPAAPAPASPGAAPSNQPANP